MAATLSDGYRYHASAKVVHVPPTTNKSDSLEVKVVLAKISEGEDRRGEEMLLDLVHYLYLGMTIILIFKTEDSLSRR